MFGGAQDGPKVTHKGFSEEVLRNSAPLFSVLFESPPQVNVQTPLPPNPGRHFYSHAASCPGPRGGRTHTSRVPAIQPITLPSLGGFAAKQVWVFQNSAHHKRAMQVTASAAGLTVNY